MNYPIGILNTSKNKISSKNRGLFLEDLINEANLYYLKNDLAIIYKKPTPIKVIKMNSKKEIIKGVFLTPSTTDYNGIYKEKYIDFEAKETLNKTSFPLNNLKSHQKDHLIRVYKHGAISFLIIYFKTLDRFFIYNTKYLLNLKSKNISLKELEKNGIEIKLSLNPKLDYLQYLDFLFL